MMNHNMQMQKETGKILHRKFLSENIGLLEDTHSKNLQTEQSFHMDM